jgi:hypothetical protein
MASCVYYGEYCKYNVAIYGPHYVVETQKKFFRQNFGGTIRGNSRDIGGCTLNEGP